MLKCGDLEVVFDVDGEDIGEQGFWARAVVAWGCFWECADAGSVASFFRRREYVAIRSAKVVFWRAFFRSVRRQAPTRPKPVRLGACEPTARRDVRFIS